MLKPRPSFGAQLAGRPAGLEVNSHAREDVETGNLETKRAPKVRQIHNPSRWRLGSVAPSALGSVLQPVSTPWRAWLL